eukprot:PhF_6_TR26416/c2_g1_i1/m.38197
MSSSSLPSVEFQNLQNPQNNFQFPATNHQCYACRGAGHRANACPVWKGRCFRCKGVGHSSSECVQADARKKPPTNHQNVFHSLTDLFCELRALRKILQPKKWAWRSLRQRPQVTPENPPPPCQSSEVPRSAGQDEDMTTNNKRPLENERENLLQVESVSAPPADVIAEPPDEEEYFFPPEGEAVFDEAGEVVESETNEENETKEQIEIEKIESFEKHETRDDVPTPRIEDVKPIPCTEVRSTRPGPTKRGRVVGLDSSHKFAYIDFPLERKPEADAFLKNLQKRFPKIVPNAYIAPPGRLCFGLQHDDQQWETFHDMLVEAIDRDESFIQRYRFSDRLNMITHEDYYDRDTRCTYYTSEFDIEHYAYFDVKFYRFPRVKRDAFLESVSTFEATYEVYEIFDDRYHIAISKAPRGSLVKFRDYIESFWVENPDVIHDVTMTNRQFNK